MSSFSNRCQSVFWLVLVFYGMSQTAQADVDGPGPVTYFASELGYRLSFAYKSAKKGLGLGIPKGRPISRLKAVPLAISNQCDTKALAHLSGPLNSNREMEDSPIWSHIEKHTRPDGILSSKAFQVAATMSQTRFARSSKGFQWYSIGTDRYKTAKVPEVTLSVLTTTFPSSLLKGSSEGLDLATKKNEIEALRKRHHMTEKQVEDAARLAYALETNPALREQLVAVLNHLGPTIFRNFSDGNDLREHLETVKLVERAQAKVSTEPDRSRFSAEPVMGNHDLLRIGITESEIGEWHSLKDVNAILTLLDPNLKEYFLTESAVMAWAINAVLQQNAGNRTGVLREAVRGIKSEFYLGSRSLALVKEAFRESAPGPELSRLTGLRKADIAKGRSFARILENNPALYHRLADLYDHHKEDLSYIPINYYTGHFNPRCSSRQEARALLYTYTFRESLVAMRTSRKKEPGLPVPSVVKPLSSPEPVQPPLTTAAETVPKFSAYQPKFDAIMGPDQLRSRAQELATEVFARSHFALSNELWGPLEDAVRETLHPFPVSDARTAHSVAARLLAPISKAQDILGTLIKDLDAMAGEVTAFANGLAPQEGGDPRLDVLAIQNLGHAMVPLTNSLKTVAAQLGVTAAMLMGSSSDLRNTELNPEILKALSELQRTLHALKMPQ